MEASKLKKMVVTFTDEDDGLKVGFELGEKGEIYKAEDLLNSPLAMIMSMISTMLGEPTSGSASFRDAKTGEEHVVDLAESKERKLDA